MNESVSDRGSHTRAADGSLFIAIAGREARLELALWDEPASSWYPVALDEWDGGWAGRSALGRVELSLTPRPDGWSYRLLLEGAGPTRARLLLRHSGEGAVYHLMPAFCHGDNGLAQATKDRHPHLCDDTSATGRSPVWGCRADRCSHPISVMITDDAVMGLSIDPYCDDARGGDAGSWVANGLWALHASGGEGPACGVSLGYMNHPHTYLCGSRFEPPTGQTLVSGSVRGHIYTIEARSRLDVHRVMRSEHARLASWRCLPAGLPEGWDDRGAVYDALRWGLSVPGWDPQRRVLCNPSWDHQRQRYDPAAGIGFHEIAWTAGATLAQPLLTAGLAAGDATAITRARIVLDRIAGAVNPASGLLYDAVDNSGACVHGWWSHFDLTPWEHFAYLNGQALFYLLRAYLADARAPGRARWRDTATAVLERVITLQQPDGTLPWSVSRSDGRVLDTDGFASCWYVAALAMGHKVTGRADMLDAAVRGFARYSEDVGRVHCYGTPLDTDKAVDQEGILAFIRAARVLHELTGDEAYLRWLEHGLGYEYLWRYAYRTRPPAAPLDAAPWTSCGGSVTSVGNPHIHPMGVMVLGDGVVLAEATGDAYHRDRAREQEDWAMICLALYPRWSGYGHYGTLSERMCPSDGLVIEQHPDGRPWALWFTHHGWGTANILEGLWDADPNHAR